ncbi:MAG TPA: SMC family ATPase [Pyrinomonadaceae bacterium]|nr:SMC family ATPase [Pyrinomonadaceae bacterium]
MPNLPHEFPPGADGVRTYLEGVLPDSLLTNATVDVGYQPLILLQTAHVMAAFAFSNGDLTKSYDALYGSFKKYYAEQHGQWDALDLAFVFCVLPDVPNLDHFCSRVETDVYFCRKFVVPLAPPLDASLARLPFLPLTPLHGRSLRPPSAQTFLQQCGVPAMLAKFLVVQRERSPEGIVEDCTDGRFGEPRDLTPALNVPVANVERFAAPVQLESVTIKDFRAYRKPQTFAVGADVTILYGPNGFGKTSFFDAIDFAVTGEIGRIRSSGEAHFKKTAMHLDSKSDESVVSLSLRCNSALRKITRKVSDRKQALLDGRSTDRKTILTELTGAEFPATDRVENFVSLFRATHLFSQEYQEFAKDFRDDCRLSEQIVSRMLAFEDYASAVKKASKVCEAVQTVISTADVEIRELSEQIADEKKELDRLGQTARVSEDMGALDAEIESLQRKVSEAGISVASEQPDAAVVRGWRASIEVRHAESESRTARLSELAKESADLPRAVVELASLRQQLAQKEQALGSADENRIATEAQLQRADQQLAEISAKRSAAQRRAELLEWVRTVQPGYLTTLHNQGDASAEVNRTMAALALHRASEAKAANDLRTQQKLSDQAAARLATTRGEFGTVQALNDTAASWQSNRTRLSAVIEAERLTLSTLELLRVEQRDLSSQGDALAAEATRLARQIEEVDQNQTELKGLLSQLQGHVRNGTCPLCGEDHGSKDKLLLRIQKHLTADAASGARVTLADVQEKASKLAEQLAASKQKAETEDAKLKALRTERTTLTAEIGRFEDAVSKLGIVIETTDTTLTEQLRALHNRMQQEVADLHRQAQMLEGGLQAARALVGDTKNLAATMASQLADKETALKRLQDEANQLRKDPRLTEVSLDVDPAQVAELERINSQNLAGFNEEAAKAQEQAGETKSRVGALRQESASLKDQLAALRGQVGNLQRRVAQITARLAESNLPAHVSEDTLLALIADESRVQAQLLALRDSAASIELAIDVVTTAAALTQLRQNVLNKERIVLTATRRRDQHQPWLKYFEGVSGLVSSQQSEAIAHFTDEYGPRTSVIQQRLRSVYGFDDIEIHSHGSTISVRVKRRGEELRPTDYFSQSQQQTLLLGLFLTAFLSQTWSGLCPVFLDDPVTHFDDLNTYAFLDLIVGLLEADSEKRQFIISTCDEKFLQLAQHKFRHLGERARFYRFKAIGADGPIVDEIA